MAKSITPNDLTQVAIQPSASPIALNVLPAPGQRLAGNTLQQVGESLAAFSPALQGMLAQRVEEDKRQLAAMGAAVDFSKAFDVPMDASPVDRQAALNDLFKKAIAKQGGPDSANPFFLIAARQNFGRAVGLRYRNALASLQAEATNPDSPAAFGDIARKAAEMAGASEATKDVYGASGFASVAQEVNAEMSIRFQEELRKRQEFVSTERAQNGIADALKVAASNPEGFKMESPVGQAMQQIIDSYQLTTTDPETSRRMVIGAFQNAMRSARDESDAEEMANALGTASFGKAAIRDNVALYARILTIKDERVREIEAEEIKKDRVFRQQVTKGVRDIYGMGLADEVSAQILAGNDDQAQVILEKKLDEWRTKNPDLDPTIANMVRFEVQKDLSGMTASVGTQRNAMNARMFEQGFDLVDEGILSSADSLRGWMQDRGLTIDQQMNLKRYFDANVGVVRTAASSYASQKGKEIQQRILTGMASGGMLPVNPQTMQPMIGPEQLDQAQTLEESWRDGAFKEVQRFVRGEAKDPASGMTYEQIKRESGTEAANRSISGVLDSYYDSRIKSYNEVQRANKAAADAGVKVGKAEPTPTQAFTQDQALLVKGSVDTLAQSFESVPMNVEQQEEAVKVGLDQEITDIYEIGRNFGVVPQTFSGRATVDERLLAKRLSEQFKVASTQGVAKAVRMGFLINDSIEFTPDSVLQQYGRVRRSLLSGLSPKEILANETYEGLPVFGTVLPARGQALEFSFSVPCFRNRSEMASADTVNKVMDALGLPQDRGLREAWVARQATLIRLSETVQRMNTGGRL
jgi:hypothetical protein